MIPSGSGPTQVESPRGWRLFALGLGLIAAYTLLGRFGLELASYQARATIIWAPSGLAVAAVWIWGPRVLWAVFLGAFLANVLVSPEWALSALIAVGNTAEAWLAGWLVRRFDLSRGLHRTGDVLVYFATIVVLATVVAAANGTLWLVVISGLPWADAPLTGFIWWLGDAGGVLVVASVIVAFMRPPEKAPRMRLEPGVIVLTVGAALVVAIGPGVSGHPLGAAAWASVLCMVLPYPAVTWAAMRLGVRGATAATATVALAAVLGTAAGAGPFQTAEVQIDVLNLWPLLATLSISAMLLASSLEERSLARRAHAEGEARLALALQAAGAMAFERDLAADRERLATGPLEVDAAVHPEDRGRLAEVIARAARGEGDGWAVEYRQGEERIDEHARVAERDAAGLPIRAVGLRRDVTDRYQAEERRIALERELERSRRLGELGLLAGGIAHDFNNLLTVVRANAEIVRKGGELEPIFEESLYDIEEAARRGKELTEQLLAYAGRRTLPSRRLDLAALAGETARLLTPRCPYGTELRYELAKAAYVYGDPVQLRQVFMNLLVNAFDAMEGRTGVVRLSVETGDEVVRVLVSDEGPGVPPEIRERLFEPFFSTKAQLQGRGMGLAAVLGIVRAHGGSIEVGDNADGRPGATFRVQLPAADTASLALERVDIGAGAGGRVLVVDDEPGVRRLTALILERAGFEVALAGEGAEALRAAAGGRPDVALLDVVLQGESGLEVMRRLKAAHPGLPIVLMSGYHECDVDPAVPMLIKPFDVEELLAAVRSVVPPAAQGTGR